MEGFGVLRACELAGVPAVELRAISNSTDEPDRSKWQFDEAFAALADAVCRVLDIGSVSRTLLQKIHNPRNKTCGCAPDCWCNRTALGRAVKWWFPGRLFGLRHKWQGH